MKTRHLTFDRVLVANNKVENCFCNAQKSVQIRLAGAVEIIEDLDLEKNIVEKYSFLQPWVAEKGYEFLTAYCLREGEACIWTRESMFQAQKNLFSRTGRVKR